MKMFPIIPVWIMIIISIGALYYIFKTSKKRWLDITILILLFIINLRVMYRNGDSLVSSSNLDVLFVIDNTISMNALDYQGNNTRLSGVREDCKYIINALNGSRFSIITFNNSSKILTPYTRDINMTNEAIDIINPIDELYAKGSSLNTPLEDMISSLKSAANKEGRRRVVFFISDGEITNDDKLASFKEVSDYVDGGAVLGYGTTSGGYMKDNGKYSTYNEYIMDNSGYNYTKAVSKIDENNLNSIAKDMGVSYIHMDKQSNINKTIREIQNSTTSKLESSDKKSYGDVYYIFAIPLFVLLILKYRDIRGELL